MFSLPPPFGFTCPMALTPAFAPLGFKGTYSGWPDATIMFAVITAIEASETIRGELRKKKEVRK